MIATVSTSYAPRRVLTETEKKESAKKIEQERATNRKIVKGKFMFYEVPGGELRFSYRGYAKDPVEHYRLVDGEIYELPLGVARHLNNNGFYNIHTHCVDENGKPSTKIGKRVDRFGFQSLEFSDDLSLHAGRADIVTVEQL